MTKNLEYAKHNNKHFYGVGNKIYRCFIIIKQTQKCMYHAIDICENVEHIYYEYLFHPPDAREVFLNMLLVYFYSFNKTYQNWDILLVKKKQYIYIFNKIFLKMYIYIYFNHSYTKIKHEIFEHVN